MTKEKCLLNYLVEDTFSVEASWMQGGSEGVAFTSDVKMI